MTSFKKRLLLAAGRSALTPPFHLRHWWFFRLGTLLSVDLILIACSYWAGYVLRLEDLALAGYRDDFLQTLPLVLVCHVIAFHYGGMYRQVWRYANINSAILIAKCVVVGVVLSLAANFIFFREAMPPRSVPIIFALLSFLLIVLSKFSWRTWTLIQLSLGASGKDRCFIYGAGTAGELLARHIVADPRFPFAAVGYLDDDRNKSRRILHGLPILGTGEDLALLCQEYNVGTIIFAMHAPPGHVLRDLVARCQVAGVKPLMMPDMANSLGSDIIQPRAIDVKDLLRRSPKSIDRERVQSFFAGQTVLVTGAGGSIGSEICRQVFDCRPRTIVLCDSSEFNLYQIEQELRDLGRPEIDIYPILGSVAQVQTVERLFERFRPTQVLHAAAFKHVPMVEANPLEGVINNVVGTKNVAEAAIRYGAERFLLISTDKAVRPTNVMGATKRLCEIMIQALSQINPQATQFTAVRFGNVLGSSGSVIPRFLQQIQAGGPVTVTHPEMTRFFMLINEAVGLVLQSITMSKGGEIFVLDMGEPVKIYEMAKQLVLLAGKVPGKDIEIVFSGLRPGEKLYEELILEGAERHQMHDDVYIATPYPSDPQEDLAIVERIIELAREGQQELCVRTLLNCANRSAATAPRGEWDATTTAQWH